MQKPSPRSGLEQRALVAIACYFLVMQALLAGLATGFSAGHMRAALGETGAFICHAFDSAPANPGTNENSPSGASRDACGLCALSAAGNTVLPGVADAPPTAHVFTRIAMAAVSGEPVSAFDPRAGRSRAPPVFV